MTASAALSPASQDGSWLLRPASFDPWRKALAIGMLGLAGAVGGITLAERVLGSHPLPLTAGAAVPTDHLTFKPAAMPNGGTAVASGYYAAPPYAPVDPVPPRPALRLDLP
jgi:hypothetical protein